MKRSVAKQSSTIIYEYNNNKDAHVIPERVACMLGVLVVTMLCCNILHCIIMFQLNV